MTVRDIFQTYGMAYLDKYADTIPDNHRKVVHAIMDCRTPAMGTILCSCSSCGNRHCPTCQGEKANDWLSKRLDQMLPVHHFMITFTVPAPFRELLIGKVIIRERKKINEAGEIFAKTNEILLEI